MSIEIGFNYPPELGRNATIRQALTSVALFVRDLWLARSPYATGDYSRGLQHQGSVKVTGGKITITNFSKHSEVIEKGFRTYNIGMSILNGGKNVKRDKEGNRYKVIKVTPKPGGATRKASVAQAVVRSFTKAMPIGMPITKLTKYGSLKPYPQRRSLQRPLKGKKPSTGAMRGVFCISEKAIKADPTKWQMPARPGRKIAERVQNEARPFVIAALKGAVKAEKDRQMRTKGIKPSWSPDLRSAFTKIPPQRRP